jgi:hypothetical protein
MKKIQASWMYVKLRNIVSLLLVVVLLIPPLVKLEHHHEHFVCNAKAEKHYHNHHEKCQICSFEFSVFMSEEFFSLPEAPNSFGVYINDYKVGYFSTTPDYTFLLRAPPVLNC